MSVAFRGSEDSRSNQRACPLASIPSARLLLAPRDRDKTFSGKGWPATAAPQARTPMRTGLPGIRPALTVALNAGMGSSYLNAEVNALERSQMIPGRNSSSSSYAQVCCFGRQARRDAGRHLAFVSFHL